MAQEDCDMCLMYVVIPYDDAMAQLLAIDTLLSHALTYYLLPRVTCVKFSRIKKVGFWRGAPKFCCC